MAKTHSEPSFADILRAKMQSFPSENTIDSAKPYAAQTWDMSQFETLPPSEVKIFRSSPLPQSAYPKRERPTAKTIAAPPLTPTRPEKRWPIHQLSLAAQMALKTLEVHSDERSEQATDISRSEVKRAYRRLAKRSHPDLNKEKASDEAFLNFKTAYDIIMSELSQKAA